MENEFLSEHKEIKLSVINLLQSAKDVYETHSAAFLEEKRDEIAAFSELIKKTEDGRFSIIVVGEFSAGKSTFLNALMHEKYLDSFSSETTANINFLRSVKDSPTGNQMIRVNYKDGHVEDSDDVSFENIQKYVSTKGNNVATEIDNVIIYLDSQFLNDGVDLIDSPGLNGVKELHADITKNQMKSSHAAIFMFRANQPGSKSDFTHLHDLKKTCKSIFIVLNRIDEAAKEGEETVEEIVEKLKENYKKEFPNETIPEVWPISAAKALVARSKKNLVFNERKDHTEDDKVRYLQTSRIEAFEDRLLRYITQGEKSKNELLSPVETVISISEDTIKELKAESETLNGKYSSTDINDQIESISQEIKNVKGTIVSKKNDVENAIYDAVRNAKNTIKSETKDIKNYVLGNLENDQEIVSLEKNAKSYVARIVSRYDATFSDALTELESEFRSAIRRNIEGSISIINQRLKSVCEGKEGILIQNVEIDPSRFGGEINLEKYDKEILDLKTARKEAQNKQYAEEDKVDNLSSVQKRIESIEQQINAVKTERISELSAISDPGVQYRDEIKQHKVFGEKRGWWNPCRWFGDTYKSHMETYTEKVPDYTAHKRYLEEKQEVEQRYAESINDLQRTKAELESKYDNMSASASVARRYQSEKEDLDRQIAEKREERDREFEEKLKEQVKSAKDYLKEIFDDLEKNTRKNAIQGIDDMESKLIELAIEVLEGEIKEELQSKESRLNNLKQKLELAEKDKEDRLANIESALDSLEDLKEKALNVRDVIRSIKTDEIEEA